MTEDAGALAVAVEAVAGGAEDGDVEAALIRRGIDRETATRTVAQAHEQIAAERERELARQRPLAAAFVAAVPAALAAGAAWGWAMSVAGGRIGALAWGIGILAGVVVVAVGKRRGRPAQLLAVGCAFLGFALGKELAFALSLHDLSAGRIGVFSLEAQKQFFSTLGSSLGVGDVLPFVLALWGAWALPRTPKPRRRVLV